MRVFFSGPFSFSGGVSIHSRELALKFLPKYGVHVICYNLSGPPITRLYKRTIGIFFSILHNSDKYELIHVQVSGGLFSFIAAISSSLAVKINKKPLYITYHYRASEAFIKKYYYFFSFVLKQCRIFYTISSLQYDLLTKIFPEYTQKMIIISNGFDPQHFKIMDKKICRSKLNISFDKKILVSVGNLVPEKGQKFLIQSMSLIVKKRNDVLCYILGDGPLYSYLEKLITIYSLEKEVFLVGKKDHHEIPFWLNSADLFVLPSIVEGNPTVMFESLGCGCPFIGSNVGGIPKIIKSDDYGFLTEPADVDDLVIKISIALDKEWDQDKILCYARQFSWQNIAEQVVKIYGKIVEQEE